MTQTILIPEEEREETQHYPRRVRLSQGFIWAGVPIAPLVMHVGTNIVLTREDGLNKSMSFSCEELVTLAHEILKREWAGLL